MSKPTQKLLTLEDLKKAEKALKEDHGLGRGYADLIISDEMFEEMNKAGLIPRKFFDE